MNIIEAIKSGRALARRDNPKHRGSQGNGFVDPDFLIEYMRLTKEDILAEDWEIEDDEIKITKSELIRAIGETAKERASKRGFKLNAYASEAIIEELESFLKRLGFK
jgi:hypothetical protein